MKKFHILIIIIIALIVICALITIPKVIQTNKENNETLITSEYTEQYRSLDVTDNTLIHTIYNTKGSNPVKTETIFTFENNIVSSVKLVSYFESINWAKTCEKTKYDNDEKIIKSRDKNILTYTLTEFEKSTKEETIKKINEGFKDVKTIN